MSQYSKEFLLLFAKYRELTLKEYLDDNEAFKFLEKSTTRDLLEKLKAEIAKNNAMGSDGFKAILAELPNIVAINKTENEQPIAEGRTVQPELQKKAEVKRENKAENTSPNLIQANNPNTCEVDRETLQKYLDAGIKLTPCRNKSPIGKVLHEDKSFIEENRVTTREQLDSFIEGKGTLSTIEGVKYPCRHRVEMFNFYPMSHKLIVLDLDAKCDEHANKTDGITNFKTLIGTLHLSEKNRAYFKDFPNNFPCYTKTPHNGLHVYFKDSYITEETRDNFNLSYFDGLNIEIRYGGRACTCAGSLNDEKNYRLFGNIADAPQMTPDLYLAFQKPKPNIPPRQTRRRAENESEEELLQKVIEIAEEKYSMEAPHMYVLKTTGLFKSNGLSQQRAIDYLTNCSKCINRRDTKDTLRAIGDLYNPKPKKKK